MRTFNARAYASVLAEAARQESASVIVVSSSTDAKYMAGILAGDLEAGYATNVVAGPESVSPLVVKRTAFSNKGFMFTELKSERNIIGVSSNAFGTHESKADCSVETFSPNLGDDQFGTKK